MIPADDPWNLRMANRMRTRAPAVKIARTDERDAISRASQRITDTCLILGWSLSGVLMLLWAVVK